MSTIRYFSGGRDKGTGNSAAAQIMRIEIQKKGKMEAQERYKLIMKMKLAESRAKAATKPNNPFNLPGAKSVTRTMSKKAEEALKQIAMRKAIKEARKLRQMVIVTPRNYHNGRLDKKGKIYDIEGNIVGQVDKKNGKMATMLGWNIGKYKPHSQQTDLLIQEAITKYSPYELKMRKLKLQQQELETQLALAALGQQQTISLYGADGAGSYNGAYGQDLRGPRSNIGVTAWGAMADNVHGTFSDNTWGTMGDNIWGTVNGDVWGSITGDSLWGVKGPKIFGTGNGRNYLKSFTNLLAGLFGFKNKKNKERLNAFRAASSGSRTGGSAPRGGRR